MASRQSIRSTTEMRTPHTSMKHIEADEKITVSPYFARHRSKVNPSVTRSPSSAHFLRSPSSAVGSIRSLGPFLSTISGYQSLSTIVCRRFQNISESKKFCPACAPVIDTAVSQFSTCDIFSKQYYKLISKHNCTTSLKTKAVNNSTNGLRANMEHMIRCWEESEHIINRCVRHLCVNKCYLRAFAPARDWRALRKNVSELTNQSPDHQLEGWRCHLISTTFDTKNLRQSDVQTIYISPDQKYFRSKVDVLRHLNLIPTVRKRKSDNLSFPSTGCAKVFESRMVNQRNNNDKGSSVLRSDPETDQALCCVHDATTRTSTLLSQSSPLKPYQYVAKPYVVRSTAEKDWQQYQFPSSPFGFLEELFSADPWRLFISTIMLNRTTRVQVDAPLCQFLNRWPDPQSVIIANPDEVSEVIQPCGMRHRRARGIIRFSVEYLELLERKRKESNKFTVTRPEFCLTRTEILGLYNCGKYASDAYQIFVEHCLGEVDTSDYALQYFIDYQRGWKGTNNY